MNKLPKGIWLQADDVARAGIDAAERGQVICVPGWRYKLVTFVAKHLPESWMLGLMKRNSKKYRKVD